MRLTHRGEIAAAWAGGLLIVLSPGLAEMLGTWVTGTPTSSAQVDVGEGVGWSGHAWVDPSQVAAGDVARNASPAAHASRSHRALPAVLLRIRACESGGNYRAENPTSTASGAWQILDGTWDGYAGYLRAKYAPPLIQDSKALLLFNDRGTKPWNASRSCWS